MCWSREAIVKHSGSYHRCTGAMFPSKKGQFLQINCILFPMLGFYQFLVFLFFPIIVFLLGLSPTAEPSYSSRSNFGCFSPPFWQDLGLQWKAMKSALFIHKTLLGDMTEFWIGMQYSISNSFSDYSTRNSWSMCLDHNYRCPKLY